MSLYFIRGDFCYNVNVDFDITGDINNIKITTSYVYTFIYTNIDWVF